MKLKPNDVEILLRNSMSESDISTFLRVDIKEVEAAIEKIMTHYNATNIDNLVSILKATCQSRQLSWWQWKSENPKDQATINSE